jgi:hypothetical protein
MSALSARTRSTARGAFASSAAAVRQWRGQWCSWWLHKGGWCRSWPRQGRAAHQSPPAHRSDRRHEHPSFGSPRALGACRRAQRAEDPAPQASLGQLAGSHPVCRGEAIEALVVEIDRDRWSTPRRPAPASWPRWHGRGGHRLRHRLAEDLPPPINVRGGDPSTFEALTSRDAALLRSGWHAPAVGAVDGASLAIGLHPGGKAPRRQGPKTEARWAESPTSPAVAHDEARSGRARKRLASFYYPIRHQTAEKVSVNT